MKNEILIIGDVHADKSSIEELDVIFEEICFKEEWDRIICLGDLFDKKNPCTEVINYVTKILTKMLKICPVDIVDGNHDAISQTISALDYSTYFGVTVHKEESSIKIGDKTIGVGHFFTDMGDQFKKDERHKVKDLSEKYNLTLLGHDHCYRELASNVFHLGSIRRQHFGEVEYGVPKIAKISTESLKMELCEVKSAIAMIDVFSIEEALKIDFRAKLRLIFTSFEEYMKNVNKLPELGKKFLTFKVKHDYIQKISKVKKEVKSGKSFEEMFNVFLKKEVKNKEVKAFIEGIYNGKT